MRRAGQGELRRSGDVDRRHDTDVDREPRRVLNHLHVEHDEVGELSLDCQAKLLRVIEGKAFRPIGTTSGVSATRFVPETRVTVAIVPNDAAART